MEWLMKKLLKPIRWTSQLEIEISWGTGIQVANHTLMFASKNNSKTYYWPWDYCQFKKYWYSFNASTLLFFRRLRELLVIMNQSDNLLVISHQAVIRCIVAYLKKIPIEELPYQKIPLHTVLKVRYDGNRNTIEKKNMHVECVDTYRPQPTDCSNERKFDDAIQTVPLHLWPVW